MRPRAGATASWPTPAPRAAPPRNHRHGHPTGVHDAIPTTAPGGDHGEAAHDPTARRTEPNLVALSCGIVLLVGLPTSTPATLCWGGDTHCQLNGEFRGLRRHRSLGLLPPPIPPRLARSRPGRSGGPRRQPRHQVDQDDREGLRHRPRDPDGRPDDARGIRHPREGPRTRLQGDAPRPGRPDVPGHRSGLRLPRHGRHRQGDARQLRRQRRRRRHGVPERPRRDGHQARRHPRRGRGRRRRDRHGHRPGCVPLRALPRGLRGDRGRQGGLRQTPTSRSSSRPASCRPTTTSAARAGWA